MCEHKAASVMMGKATAVNGPTLNQRGASTVSQEEEQQSAEAKSAFQWQKLRAKRTKVIKFISEEDTQEQAAVLQELVDEYRAHQIAADRKVCSRMCVHTCPKVRIHFFFCCR
jgi:phosphotransferase system HPr-like phosphotransfer protein